MWVSARTNSIFISSSILDLARASNPLSARTKSTFLEISRIKNLSNGSEGVQQKWIRGLNVVKN